MLENVSKKEIRQMIIDYIDVLEHDCLYYWTYKKSLEVFSTIVDIAYDTKSIDKKAYKGLKSFIKEEYNEKFKGLENERI